LEVHQFAQEAVVADAWLTAHEPVLKSCELGSSVDEVEQLIRRHEAFRKAAAIWEERFSSLRRLTTLEKLKAEQSKQPATPLLGRKFLGEPSEPGLKGPSLLRQAEAKLERQDLLRGRPQAPALPSGGPGEPAEPLELRVAYVRQEMKLERLQPRLDRVQEGLAAGAERLREAKATAEEMLEAKPSQHLQVPTVSPVLAEPAQVSQAETQPEQPREQCPEPSEQEMPRHEQAERRRERRERRLE
ncbi:spectrin beta chain, non-erythrocytic 4-like, partial [Chelonoidis abingdonii]|uniref:spectrin beta chain, non-erythrocytic 4-like n=1 Tax=Chelonoidis abingdonii TaxID=106734 RepID=UPI0013F23796